MNISRPESPEGDVPARIAILNQYHTQATYRYVSLGLFERHKLLFTWLLTIKLQEDPVDPELHSFILRGVASMVPIELPPNPASQWLSEPAWRAANELDRVHAFRGLVPHIE